MNDNSKTTGIKSWLENDQRRPVYQRYQTTAILFVVILLLGIIFLPAKGALTGLQKMVATVIMALSFMMILTVITDMNKSVFVQMGFAIFFILEIAYIIAFYSGVDFSSLSHIFFNWQIMNGQWSLILQGLGMTLRISFYSILVGVGIGLVLTILRQMKNKVITALCVGYLNMFRIMPQIVILFFVYFGLPYAKIVLSPFFCGVAVLGMSSGAFIGEIFRSGIESIHKTQFEASRALGLSFFQTMRLVILPQAFRIVIPSLANQCVGVIKDTAICSMISLTDLLKSGQIIATWKANPTPLIVAAGVFLIVLLPLTIIVNQLEKAQKNKKVKAI